MDNETIDLKEVLFDSKFKGLTEKEKTLVSEGFINFTVDEILRFGKLVAEKTLELASKNLGLIEILIEQVNGSDEYAPFITADDDTLWTIDKNALLGTIKQIK